LICELNVQEPRVVARKSPPSYDHHGTERDLEMLPTWATWGHAATESTRI
jgi:hypothetical protein